MPRGIIEQSHPKYVVVDNLHNRIIIVTCDRRIAEFYERRLNLIPEDDKTMYYINVRSAEKIN